VKEDRVGLAAERRGSVSPVSDRVDPRVEDRISGPAVAIGVFAAACGTVLALLTRNLGEGPVVAIFMLAVTVAAVTGGIWAGIFAALLSALALRFIKIPLETGVQSGFAFEQLRDVVAGVVFLAIAAVVGLVVGNAAAERRRASEREREARLLAFLSSKLLSGDLPDRVLDEFVSALLEPFALATCTVEVTLDGQAMAASARREGTTPGGPTEVIPVVIASIPLGTLTTERPAKARGFSRREHELLEAATRQAAVALDRARLDARARLAQLDAETNQLRAAMFSSVTHDLRTPLASIKAGVTSLLDTSTVYDTDQQRDLLLTILEETDRLNRLVGNILDLARIRAGALIPRRVSTDVEEVAEAVVARMRPRLASVRLDLHLTNDVPEIPADPVQLDQVLTNLLENAARHSPTGGTVRIEVGRDDGSVRLRVTDEGPGIPRSEREKVFEAFYRGREDPERPGSGLGLAIARAIVTAHGGDIWIEDSSAGTAVVLDLPIEEAVV
jgi:two-component system, OmpR family, sensor histidine kinase KdpD